MMRNESMQGAEGAGQSYPANWFAVMDEYESALRAVEHAYPALNPDAVDFDERAMLEVYAAMKSMVKQGTAPALALQTAAAQTLDRRQTH